MSADLAKQIKDLFVEAGKAHHEAFMAVDGADPDWALWYAHYLRDKLPLLLKTEMTQSLIVFEFVRLDQEFRSMERDEDWTSYYAQQLIEKYLSFKVMK